MSLYSYIVPLEFAIITSCVGDVTHITYVKMVVPPFGGVIFRSPSEV